MYRFFYFIISIIILNNNCHARDSFEYIIQLNKNDIELPECLFAQKKHWKNIYPRVIDERQIDLYDRDSNLMHSIILQDGKILYKTRLILESKKGVITEKDIEVKSSVPKDFLKKYLKKIHRMFPIKNTQKKLDIDSVMISNSYYYEITIDMFEKHCKGNISWTLVATRKNMKQYSVTIEKTCFDDF